MTLVILGDSHTFALFYGLCQMSPAERDELGRPILVNALFSAVATMSPFFVVTLERLAFRSSNASKALEEVIGLPYFSEADRGTLFGFSMGLVTSFLVRSEVWRHFIPWRLTPEDGQELLSDGVTEAIALAHNVHVIEFFERLVGLGIRCFAVAAPPLSPNEEVFRQAGRVEVVLEVDRIARRAVATKLVALGVPVVWPPDETYEGLPGRSLLRPDLAVADDPVHGTPDYGRLMLKQIVRQTAGLRPWLLLPTLVTDRNQNE